MLRVFQQDLFNPDNFVITLELVPGREVTGRSMDAIKGIARDAFADGRVSAVSITDNPGGNPSLSPDVIGHEIFKVGMDVIVHFTCRDMNRVGMESRALQLAMMGMKNLLALTGDYTGAGFGGRGAPVFDLDSVTLQMMLKQLNMRLDAAGEPDDFLTGCAASPFKRTEAETFAQYAKLCRKIASGAQFIITQLGYDARKFAELQQMLKFMRLDIPVMGSVYILTPKAARIMNQGRVPGAVVTDKLCQTIEKEWKDAATGRQMAIERAARLGVVLKGLGYRGMHIGGVHTRFDPVAKILDRMAAIADRWPDYVAEFNFPMTNGFYAFPEPDAPDPAFNQNHPALPIVEKLRFESMRFFHERFFTFDSDTTTPQHHELCRWIDDSHWIKTIFEQVESVAKIALLGCRECGDCGIQHLAFLCPESQCPKHTRNGACGGSANGRCEVHPEQPCVWTRAYKRLASRGQIQQMAAGCVPPRMWELDHTSSWLNFHLMRDHQSVSQDLAGLCAAPACSPRQPD